MGPLRRIEGDAILLLFVGQAALVAQSLLDGAGSRVALAGLSAVLAVVLSLVWKRARRQWVLVLTLVAGSGGILLPLPEPVAVGSRLLVGLGVMGLVGFLEFGNLRSRVPPPTTPVEAEAVLAIRRQMIQVFAWTSVALAIVLASPVFLASVLAPPVARSVELASAWGIAFLGVVCATLVLLVSRVMHWRARRALARGGGALERR